jgi:hypothetical protein
VAPIAEACESAMNAIAAPDPVIIIARVFEPRRANHATWRAGVPKAAATHRPDIDAFDAAAAGRLG